MSKSPSDLTVCARMLGLSPLTVASRIHRGWPIERALEPLANLYRPAGTGVRSIAISHGINPTTFQRRLRYGLTVDEALSCPKDSRCECCGEVLKLQADHDHTTKRFRGWLCWRCNSSIGKFGDDTDGIEKALAYLKRVR